jgi:hypothetical protein
MQFDIGHYAILVASVLGIIGPDVLAHLSATQAGTTSKVVGAIVVVLSAVAALLKPSVVSSVNAAACDKKSAADLVKAVTK